MENDLAISDMDHYYCGSLVAVSDKMSIKQQQIADSHSKFFTDAHRGPTPLFLLYS